jgi:hypothetical protein
MAGGSGERINWLAMQKSVMIGKGFRSQKLGTIKSAGLNWKSRNAISDETRSATLTQRLEEQTSVAGGQEGKSLLAMTSPRAIIPWQVFRGVQDGGKHLMVGKIVENRGSADFRSGGVWVFMVFRVIAAG